MGVARLWVHHSNFIKTVFIQQSISDYHFLKSAAID